MPINTPIVENPPMPNYTHLNLNDVENQAPNFGLDEGMEARFATGDLGLEQSGAGFILPRARVPGPVREEANIQPGWWQD